MIFVLVGGKNKDNKLNNIEKWVYNKTNKEKPRLLFIPLASTNINKTINNFYKLVSDINFDVSIMDFNNLDKFEFLINDADIIYVSGGISDNLIKVFEDNNLDKILYNHLDDDKIYVGVSAGAMLITKEALGDKDMFYDNFHYYNYKMVKCLGFLNISICPHYQNEDLIIYNDIIKNLNIISFGIEEDSALVIDKDKYYVIKDRLSSAIYCYDNNKFNNLVIGEVYEKSGGFRS